MLAYPRIKASYAVSVRQYRILSSRFLYCIPHGKPACDVLMIRGFNPLIRDLHPLEKYTRSKSLLCLKICIFAVFQELTTSALCLCRAHTCNIAKKGFSGMRSSSPASISLHLDSDVLRIPFQAILKPLCTSFEK